MKKTKNVFTFTSLLLCIVLMCSMLVSCDSMTKQQADETVKSFFLELQHGDFSAAATYLDKSSIPSDFNIATYKEEDPGAYIILKTITENLSYTIVSTASLDDNSAIVRTTISAPDMNSIISEFVKTAVTDIFTSIITTYIDKPIVTESAATTFAQYIEKGKVTKLSSTVDINVKKNADGKWVIAVTDTLVEAISGNLKTAINNALQ